MKQRDERAIEKRKVLNLKEADKWTSIKKRVETLFEFFATQAFGGCDIWKDVYKDIRKDKVSTEDWAEIQVKLELLHDHPLHKCKSCHRQFLAWATEGNTSTEDWKFCQTIEFLIAIDKNFWTFEPEWFKGTVLDFVEETQKGFDLDADIEDIIFDLRAGEDVPFDTFIADADNDSDWFDDDDSEEESSDEDVEWTMN